MTQASVTFTTINGIQTAQIICGAGRPLLMLHGWGANTSLMWPLAARLVPLGYHIFIPDLPGFGQTAPPPTGWSVHDYVAFVLAYLDHHGLEQVALFGHSFGGRLGLVLGAQQGERITQMALADSAGLRLEPSFPARVRQSVYRFAQRALTSARLARQVESLRSWYSERYGSPDYKAAQGVMRETFVRVVNEDLLPYAAHVRPSTLLFWGSEDADTPLWQGQLLEKTIPDAGLVVFEGAGHYSYLDRLADTTRILDHFLKQHPS